jgi:hypothetical protein
MVGKGVFDASAIGAGGQGVFAFIARRFSHEIGEGLDGPLDVMQAKSSVVGQVRDGGRMPGQGLYDLDGGPGLDQGRDVEPSKGVDSATPSGVT